MGVWTWTGRGRGGSGEMSYEGESLFVGEVGEESGE